MPEPDRRPEGRREVHKRATRENLISAAERLFVERGYRGTTVQDIAESAGVTERTFFRYFASKDELVAARAVDGLGLLQAAVIARPAEEPPLEAIRNAVLAALRVARQQSSRPTLLVLFEQGPPGPRMWRSGPHLLLRFEGALAAAIDARDAVGARPGAGPSFRSEVLAAAAVAACRRAFIRYHRGEPDDGEPDIEAILTEAFATLQC